MCGRFSLTLARRLEVEETLGVRLPEGLRPRYNVAPTQEVLALVHDPDGLKLERFRWGLVPAWASDHPSSGRRLINARAETLFARPSFREAARRRRCLILADGFYEWQRRPDGRKIPFYVRLKGGRPFGMAGVWEARTCAVVTVEAHERVKPVHDRMPAIFPLTQREWIERWLDPDARPAELLGLLLRLPTLPQLGAELELYPVSRRVNRADVDDPSCVRPLSRTR